MHMSQSRCQQYLQAQRHLNTSMQLLNGIKEGASINGLNLGVDVSGGMCLFRKCDGNNAYTVTYDSK
jgi:hypothetical protein